MSSAIIQLMGPSESEAAPPREGVEIGSEVVRRIQQGDIEAFDMLFREYYPRLFAFAESYGRYGSDMSEDIVCDVLGWVWENRTTWKPKTSVEVYLYGAVRNKIQNITRDTKRDTNRKLLYARWQQPSGIDERSVLPDRELERDEIRIAVRECLERLSETHRLIVLLRWDKQWSWNEIAEVVGISSAAAQMQHSRALKLLRTALQKYFKK